MLFPLLSNITEDVTNLLKKRAGNNRLVSGLRPWLRISSAYKDGLILESIQQNSGGFVNSYGDNSKSGRVGVNFAGESVFVENDRAFRPSPVIEALSLTFGAGGLSRKTNFAIKCFTLKQAEKLQIHFSEPGFTVLVEYGWNTNEALTQKANLSSGGACEMAKYNNYYFVKEKEEKSRYQYSGYLGFITKSSLKNAEGESYILDIELTTIGEIPAFLQTAKNGDVEKSTSTPTGKKFSESDIENAAEDGDIGQSLFMQMYNRLPQEKQTASIKNLKVEQYQDAQGNTITNLDSRGRPWTFQGNFINMDDKVREKLSEDLTDANIETSKNDSKAKIPEGINLFNNASFIRLELAFEILNKFSLNLKPIASKCTGVKTYNFTINTNNTLCRGFKYMFSTDSSKLLIPNRNHPRFDLLKALTSSDELSGDSPYLGITDNIPDETITLDQFPNDWQYCFPQVIPLDEFKWPDGVITQKHPAHSYGYLKDLFINFEFFCEVLGRNNVVNKDIYYELLNGISSAVDNYWYFEIAETPNSDDGNNELAVYDLTLCSPDRSLFKECPKFMSSGVDTPFLTSNFDMSLPAAMKNSIIGKRNSTPVNLNSDGATDADIAFIFAEEQDPVLDILNSFQVQSEEDQTDSEEPENPDEDEIRKANFEIFLQYASVFTNVKDREGDFDVKESTLARVLSLGFRDGANANADEILYVGAWSDRALFKQLQKGDTSAKEASNILIPITFEFETFGLTGIVTGQLFKIIDLPAKFKDSAFQVVEISHELGDNMWKTKVKGQLRNFS